MTASIVSDAEEWVKSELAGQDGSHDWWHIVRVRATALSLAHEENLPTSSMRTVELAALLHDVRDWKYSGDANAGAEAVRSWLTDHGHPTDDTATVVEIVSKMGFKEELSAEASTSVAVLSPEFKVVQDADRLDAIGALGIARTFCYGGSRGDPMHVPGVIPARGSHQGGIHGPGRGTRQHSREPLSREAAQAEGHDEERERAKAGGREARVHARVPGAVPRRVGWRSMTRVTSGHETA